MPLVECVLAPMLSQNLRCAKYIDKRDIFCLFAVSPIPEIFPGDHDSVSAMCQQLSQGLSLLSSSDDFGPLPSQSAASTVAKQLFTSTTTNSPPGMTFQQNCESYLFHFLSQ